MYLYLDDTETPVTISFREFADNPKRHLKKIKRNGPLTLTNNGNLIAQVRRVSSFSEIEAGARTLLVSGLGRNTNGLLKPVTTKRFQIQAASLLEDQHASKNYSIVLLQADKPVFVVYCYVGRVESVILDHADAMQRPYSRNPDGSVESVEQGLRVLDG